MERPFYLGGGGNGTITLRDNPNDGAQDRDGETGHGAGSSLLRLFFPSPTQSLQHLDKPLEGRPGSQRRRVTDAWMDAAACKDNHVTTRCPSHDNSL